MSEPKEECEQNATTEDWREISEKMTTDEKNQYMLEHGILTDCTFVVGPEEGATMEFKAHRLLLCKASAVFEKMLTGEMVEAKTGNVRVTDLSPNTFQLLLSSIYGKHPLMTTSFQEAQEFAYAAHKYQMKLLLERGVMRMGALIAPENIWTAFEIADLLQNERLKNMCIQALQCDTLRCITDPGFMQASEENVALLLEQDELNVDDEQLLVNMTVHWARRETQRRGLTGDDVGVRAVLEPRLLSLFRFLAMSPQQFTLGHGVAGWLTVDEKDEVYKCLQSKSLGGELLPHLCATAKKRKLVTNNLGKNPSNMLICKREIIGTALNTCEPCELGIKCGVRLYDNCRSHVMQYYDSPCYQATLIFSVRSNCQWLGFQRANRCTTNTTLSAKNKVYRENIIIQMYTLEQTLSSDFPMTIIDSKEYQQYVEFNSNSTVMFDKPIPLVTDNWYALEVVLHEDSDVGHYRNPERARRVRTTGAQFVFHTEQRKGYHNSKNEGLIEALMFSL